MALSDLADIHMHAPCCIGLVRLRRCSAGFTREAASHGALRLPSPVRSLNSLLNLAFSMLWNSMHLPISDVPAGRTPWLTAARSPVC